MAGVRAQIGAPNMRLRGRCIPTSADVPAAALLDPVANIDLREPSTRSSGTAARGDVAPAR
ncbi:MAG: hypothetical protein IPM40_07315 [Gammaproteobacteria bacterium]|nr:hypothetical protein [Gammaproteobacteria bacterium]